MNEQEREALPPLPEPSREAEPAGYMPGCPTLIEATPDYYTADQMRAYARAALAATPAPAAPADPVTDGEQRAAFDAAFRAYEAERKYYDEGKGHWTRLAAAKERVWQSIAAAPAAPATDAEAIRAIFQAGRDSYATPCIPMNSADEAWEEYAKEHGIGKKLSPNA